MDKEVRPWLIVGLGNPELKYSNTRHNFGAILLDYIGTRWNRQKWRSRFSGKYCSVSLGNIEVHLLFPLTYMNLSGQAVSKACKKLLIPTEHIIILHDDVDLDFGRIKIKAGGGAGGHNGLKSITALMGDNNFIRVRLGIGRPSSDIISYVLGDFSQLEMDEITSIMEISFNAVDGILNKGVSYAMNAHNRNA